MSALLDLPTPEPPRSPEIQYLKGGFSLGTSSVPFFSACLEAERLSELLKLPSQIPFDPNRPIALEELFQRELDEDRVRDEIVPYLKRDQQLRFFNALTVVLMPLEPGNSRRLAQHYPDDPSLAPRALHDGLESKKIGPILLEHRPGDDRAGVLTWNRDLVLPIVLDGQHRLHAIRTIINETSGQLRQDLGRSLVSVLFLVLAEDAGYKSPGPVTVTAACRDIFIALNKHAKTVPTARLYLLDDRDLIARAMRSIVAEEVETQGRSVAERVNDTGRLPLTLLDWRNQSAKFDTKPFVSSILALYDTVQTIADIPKFDANDYSKAGASLERLEARFELGGVEGFDGPAIRRLIRQAEQEEKPFELPWDAIDVAGRRFAAKFGPRIVQPLIRIRPYADLLDALSAEGVLGTALEPWLSFNETERRRLVEQLDIPSPEEAVRAAWQPIKEERYPLAFQVVFQKGILASVNAMVERVELVAPEWGFDDQPSEDEFIAAWIERFNTLIAVALRDNSRRSAFYGAGIGFDGNIDFRKSRVPAITGFISYLMLAPLDDWVADLRENDDMPRDAIEEWLVEKWDNIRPGQRRGLPAVFSEQGKSWRRSVNDLVVARMEDERLEVDEDERDELRLKHGVEQLARVVQANLGDAQDAEDDEQV